VRPDQLPLGVMTYVAETDAIAEKEGLEHIQYFFETALRTIPQFLAPPGYLSIEQLKARAAVGDKLHGTFNFKNLEDMIFIAVGGPEKVANLIGEWTHHITMFAEEVMPRLRGKVTVGETHREAAE
jgi:hypothetical protein